MFFTGFWKEKEKYRVAAELEKELRKCASDGDFERARELVEIQRVNVNCTDEYGRTPLMCAAFPGYLNISRFLLENGAEINARSQHQHGNNHYHQACWAAVAIAVSHGNITLAQLFLEYGADIETRCCSSSLLGWAIFKGNFEMVSLLLRFGANTDATLYEDKICSALYIACRQSNMRIVQLLLDHDNGSNVNSFIPRDNDSPAMSPLCEACKKHDCQMIRLLIQHGAPVIFDGVYPDVPCPLVHAIKNRMCWTDDILFLLDNSRFSENVNVGPPELMLVEATHHPLSAPLETAIDYIKQDVVQLLVDRGAPVNDQPFLWQCTTRGHRLEIARILLRAGANVNLADRESGETPLWAAAESGHVELIKELLKARADVRIRDNGGETPLGVAYRHGHVDVVYLLLLDNPHVWSKLEPVFQDASYMDLILNFFRKSRTT